MTDFTVLGSFRRRVLFILILAGVIFLTLAAALRYSIPLTGIPDAEVRRLDTGWFYEDGDSLRALEKLPCELNLDSDSLSLIHMLSGKEQNPEDVLAVQTRYQSIRVWADETLIYEAAQGREYALSSMWHFIPAEKYGSASALRIELKKYDSNSEWELFPVFQAHPDTIRMYILQTHLPVILTWICCMLLTVLLLVVILFMAVGKLPGISVVFSLAVFIFLSGMWILLDSKITTVSGGNYALTYFFSYCVFYLLPVPLLFYFQLILGLKNRILRCLIWITAGNAGLWMMLYYLNIVPIWKTTASVHVLIIVFLIVFVREFVRVGKKRQERRLICTFWGIFFIFVAAIASIILYHARLLPPANSGVLYVWGLLALILCMIMDTVRMFERIWQEKNYAEFYRQLATEDHMTRLFNRNAYELRLQDLAVNPPETLCFIIFDLDQMKGINDTYGHHAGDEALSLVAGCIREVFGKSGACYRIGGDEFCVILTSDDGVSPKLRQFDTLLKTRNKNHFTVHASHGWAARKFQEGKPIAFGDIIELKMEADKNLYRDKNAHAERK